MEEPRSIVRQFAYIMEEKLFENEYKGGWEDCDYAYLIERLQEETLELFKSLNNNALSRTIIREAADIANYAMMIADNCERVRGKKYSDSLLKDNEPLEDTLKRLGG